MMSTSTTGKPQQADTAAHPQQKQAVPSHFMFINSVVAPDRRLLRSYLMKRHWERRKPSNRIGLRGLRTLAIRGGHGPGGISSSLEEYSDIRQYPTEDNLCNVQDHTCNTTIPDVNGDRSDISQPGAAEAIELRKQKAKAPSLTSQYRTPTLITRSSLISWRCDPFISYPVELTPQIRHVLDHGMCRPKPCMGRKNRLTMNKLLLIADGLLYSIVMLSYLMHSCVLLLSIKY